MHHLDRLLIGAGVIGAFVGGIVVFGLFITATWVYGFAVPVLTVLLLFVAYVIGGWVLER